MPQLLKQSQTAEPLIFLMIDSTDHIAGKAGLTPTVTLSKNGGSPAAPSGAVTEIANGLYKVAGNATDTGTLGPLWLHATGTGADPVDKEYQVVAFDPQSATNLGLSALPTANPAALGGLLTSPTTANIGTVDVLRWNGTAVPTPDTAGYPKVTLKSGTGTGEVSLTSGLVTLAAVTHTGATIPTVTTTTTSTNVTTVNGLAANVLTTASIAADAFTAAKFNADVSAEIAAKVLIDILADANFVDLFADALETNGELTLAAAEPAAPPAANASRVDKIDWLFTLARNKLLTTASTITLRNDADSADVATAAHSESGGTYTRAEWS